MGVFVYTANEGRHMITNDVKQPSKPATVTVDTQQVSTPQQQAESEREAWRQELGRKMVEAGRRMETDPEYRKQIQARTR
jgi:hypothetical protein